MVYLRYKIDKEVININIYKLIQNLDYLINLLLYIQQTIIVFYKYNNKEFLVTIGVYY